MDAYGKHNGDNYQDQLGVHAQRDTTIQIIFSLLLGITAFGVFCTLRPRWKSLYAARKHLRDEALPLPDLPDSFFGWIPALYRVTEQQVLASAGLDAYVFLRFFKLACKFLAVTLFFSLVVFKPVHDAYPEPTRKSNGTHNSTEAAIWLQPRLDFEATKGKDVYDKLPTNYLWMYLIFAYFFSGLLIYSLITETERIIGIRQHFLGSQQTVTDRTIRLSGIPPYLRSERKIKQYVEGLGIGNVEGVTLCRQWAELDDKVRDRYRLLRRLEESWTIYLTMKKNQGGSAAPASDAENFPDRYRDEEAAEDDANTNGGAIRLDDDARPKETLRYGFLKIRSRQVDAIQYYEELLREIDDEIKQLRVKDYKPTALAFVTMDSVAACAVLDPSPLQLIAKPSPAPGDVIWRNTYMPRWERMSRGWAITIVITVLTIFWSLLLVPIAGALNLETIHRVWPQLAETLKAHPIAKSLVETQLPTLISSLLFVAVPYLYDWLANYQGMTSQGDVDMSVISKNFFFVFFNYFVIFTLLGTATNFLELTEKFEDSLKDTTKVAYTLAQSLQSLAPFYTNLIILQGIGLFPFRLLEFGSVALYPLYRMGCKTPRDYTELAQPPRFLYGFYMPQIMLIFIICIVYSVLRDSWKVLLAGLLYFLIGGFVYKYQLLYAMDHRQQSTGRGWIMMCNRIIIGLWLFQLNVAGQLALKGAVKRGIFMVPLLLATIWFSYRYSASYEPLMKFIALGSVERERPGTPVDPDGWGEQVNRREQAETHPGYTVDDSSTGPRFLNPSLITP